jgi:transposase
MGKHLSVDVRNMIIRMRQRGLSFRRIEQLSGVAKSTAQRWCASHLHQRPMKRKTRYRKWSDDIANILRQSLQAAPYQTLTDLKKKIPMPVSVSAISKWIRKHLMYSRKRASKHFKVHNPDIQNKTVEFAERVMGMDMGQFLSIDETAIYTHHCPNYGYSPKGCPLSPMPFSQRRAQRRYTLVAAVSATALVHFEIMEGSCNSERFASFIRNLPDDVPTHLMMDNVAFHKSELVRRAAEDRQLVPLFVPPYSPQFNPIEIVFGQLKHGLRRSCHDSTIQTIEELSRAIVASCRDSTLWNAFAHCFRVLGEQTFL